MKKAIQRLIRGDDGKLKIVFIDAVTLKQLPNSQGYQVINSNADQYWEPVQSVDKPNVPSATTSIQDLNPEINSHGTDRQSELGITTSSKPPESLARQSVRESLKPSSSSTRVSPESSVRALAVNPDISPSVSTASRVNPESVQERQVSETNPEIAKSIPGEVNPLGIGNTPTGLARLDYSGLAGKHRNQPPDADFMKDIQESVTGFFGPGYTVHLQAGKGRLPGKYGNANHPFKALDFTISDPAGKKVSQSRMEDFGAYAVTDMGKKFTGVGIGPGYMSPGEMHLDKVHRNPTAWGYRGTGATMTPGVESAIEQAGRTGAPVYGMGLPEYMGTIPTPRPQPDVGVASAATGFAGVGGRVHGVGSISPMNFDGSSAQGVGIAGQGTIHENLSQNIASAAREPTGIAQRQPGLDPVISDNITGASPAKFASLGLTPRTPAEIAHMAYTLSGELSPTSLAGVASQDPTAMRELADMVTSIENRANSKTFNGITGTLTPSQYDSLKSANATNTKANYSKYGQTLEAAIGDYYSGNLTPDNFDITSYHNPSISNPKWSAGMTGVANTGPHKFGQVNDGLYDPSRAFERERAKMGIAQRQEPDSFTGRPDYAAADWGGYGYSSRKDSPSERGSRFGGTGLGYSGKGGLDSPSESGSRFGGSGLGQGYSGKGGLDSPSESARSSGGSKGSSKGSGFASGGSDKEKDRSLGGSDKEKDRSLDRDSGKKDHSKGGYNAD